LPEKNRVLLDYTSPNGPTTRNVRGSLIASSLQTLREQGHYERYLALLPANHRDTLLFALASSWLPIEAAAAHYQACDALKLGEPQLIAIGEAVAKRIMGTFLGTLLRSGRSLGAAPTPWLALTQYHRICERIIDGGTFMVREVGPKDAIVQTRGLPLFEYGYFRTATLGMFRGGVGVFAKTCFARELVERSTRDSMAVSVRWV
jgi:hypothetical protein